MRAKYGGGKRLKISSGIVSHGSATAMYHQWLGGALPSSLGLINNIIINMILITFYQPDNPDWFQTDSYCTDYLAL
jgi:hypothetical protein